MEIYCVKDRRKIPNGSERETLTKNGRRLLKAKCAVFGITKTRFLPGSVKKKMTQGDGLLPMLQEPRGTFSSIRGSLTSRKKGWKRGDITLPRQCESPDSKRKW